MTDRIGISLSRPAANVRSPYQAAALAFLVLLSVGFAATPTPRIMAAVAALDDEARWEASFLRSVSESAERVEDSGRGAYVTWAGDAYLTQRSPNYFVDDIWDASLIVHEAGHMRGKARSNAQADFLDECGPLTAQAAYLRRMAEGNPLALVLLRPVEAQRATACGGDT